MPSAPFAPLIAGADGLQDWPAFPDSLRQRMGEVYGVPCDHVLPTRGAAHGLELVFRRLARDGAGAVQAPAGAVIDRLCHITGLQRVEEATAGATLARIVMSPSPDGAATIDAEGARGLAAGLAPALLVIDESLVDFADQPSLAPLACELDNLVVVRSLSYSHGLAGARCGALIARAATLAGFEDLLEPFAIPTPSVRAALAALSPSRMLATDARIATVKAEARRLVQALASQAALEAVEASGPFVLVTPADPMAAAAQFTRLGIEAEWIGRAGCTARVGLGSAEVNDRLLAAFGAAPQGRPRRQAQSVRDTKETQIAVLVDLDQRGSVKVETGFGFFDHMLEQVAVHGGFDLQLGCTGDLHIDPHHVIEDCALAVGAALNQALGDRRGIGRFGFTLPMDETEARISIDLGGRPYAVFEGAFDAALLGDYPTQMTAHVFRSLSETLRAAIHVEVKGDNDHHKTEACFKAFGRALRQAIRIEDDAMPSSKGVL